MPAAFSLFISEFDWYLSIEMTMQINFFSGANFVKQPRKKNQFAHRMLSEKLKYNTMSVM